AKLGSGSHGTVYKGRQGVRVVAAKLYLVRTSKRAQAVIKKEIGVLEKLKYRHIIQFYEAVYHEGRLTVVTDFADGGSLKAAIDKGLKDWPTMKRFAREMVLGLAYIHSEGVLHLDLKSENVLLTNRFEVKLCDFGRATIKSTSVATNSTETQQGAVRWMAPELFVDRPMCSTKSDVYSLGMVMWEMAANCTTPFKAYHDNATVIALVKDGKREHLPVGTPAHYRAWVEQCWDHDPSQRPEAIDFITRDDDDDDGHIPCTFSLPTLEKLSVSSTSTNDACTSNQAKTDNASSDGTKTARASSLKSIPAPEPEEDDVFSDCEDTSEMLVNATETPSQEGLPKEGVTIDEMDETAAFERCFQAANRGDSEEQHRLGNMFISGQGAKINVDEAAKWYLLSAQQGHVVAQRKIGLMYAAGQGVELPRPEAAASWLLKAAQQGDAKAQHYIGEIYKVGRGVSQRDAEAIKWFTKAAHQGISDAQFSLGEMYAAGRGVKQSFTEAAKLFTKAANQDHPQAQAKLGVLYQKGLGVEKSATKALKWFKDATNHDVSFAQFSLGMMYMQGEGMEKSEVEAFKWFIKAANQGLPGAEFIVGMMYTSGGEACRKDHLEASKWYTRSANHGDPDAQLILGYKYEMGDGVQENEEEAIKWYTMAAKQGQSEAYQCLANIRQRRGQHYWPGRR
ncbi:hypothetical protein DFQ27_008058, partial [Actinomortierella ambigua]